MKPGGRGYLHDFFKNWLKIVFFIKRNVDSIKNYLSLSEKNTARRRVDAIAQ